MKMITTSYLIYMWIIVTCVNGDHLPTHPNTQCETPYGCGEPPSTEPITHPDIENTDQRVQNLRREYSTIVVPQGETYYPFYGNWESDFDFQWDKFNGQFPRIFNQDKRGTKFSSWGGKRADAPKQVITKDSKGDKRYTNQFHSWGGKRSAFTRDVNFLSLLEELDKLMQHVRYTIIKIQEEYATERNLKHVKRSIPLVMENTDMIQHFLKLADKGTEEKKGWKINAFRENLEKTHRRGSDFFSWGGKRNDKSTSGLK